jgi:hypothetical protein
VFLGQKTLNSFLLFFIKRFLMDKKDSNHIGEWKEVTEILMPTTIAVVGTGLMEHLGSDILADPTLHGAARHPEVRCRLTPS